MTLKLSGIVWDDYDYMSWLKSLEISMILKDIRYFWNDNYDNVKTYFEIYSIYSLKYIRYYYFNNNNHYIKQYIFIKPKPNDCSLTTTEGACSHDMPENGPVRRSAVSPYNATAKGKEFSRTGLTRLLARSMRPYPFGLLWNVRFNHTTGIRHGTRNVPDRTAEGHGQNAPGGALNQF